MPKNSTLILSAIKKHPNKPTFIRKHKISFIITTKSHSNKFMPIKEKALKVLSWLSEETIIQEITQISNNKSSVSANPGKTITTNQILITRTSNNQSKEVSFRNSDQNCYKIIWTNYQWNHLENSIKVNKSYIIQKTSISQSTKSNR